MPGFVLSGMAVATQQYPCIGSREERCTWRQYWADGRLAGGRHSLGIIRSRRAARTY